MKKLLLSLSFVILSAFSFAQDMLGIRSSNYAGLNGIGLNPSSAIDNRLKLDINIASAGVTLENDFLFIQKKDLNFLGFGNIVDRIDAKEYLEKFVKGEATAKNLTFGSTIMGPSLMITFNKKHTLAVSYQLRSGISVNNVLPEVAHYGFTELGDSNLYTPNPNQFRARDFTFNTLMWQEYNLTYGTVFHNKNRHMLKGAATVKYLGGIIGSYVRDPDVNFNVANDSTLIFGPSSFEYGRVSYNTFDAKAEDKQRIINGGGFGWDLGFAYEWRKDPAKYTYEMDGKMMEDPEQNKYWLRLGASLIDMGRINFKHNSKVFNINSSDPLSVYPDFKHDDFDSQLDFDSTVSAIFYAGDSSFMDGTGAFVNTDFFDSPPRNKSFSGAKESFKMETPAAWSIQADWNMIGRFYLNATVIQGFKHKKNPGIDRPDILSLTPRYESEWVDISLPFSVINYEKSQARLGFAIRLGSVFFGSDKIGTLLGFNDLYGMDAYAGLKVSLLQARPRDRDRDHVSDKKDKCIDVPGVWKFEGCPDRDADGIQDKDDLCPDVAGLEKFRGCPDRDKDDIEDSKDDCPDDPGLPEFNGCPDRDRDGIIDKRDSCPDLPGIPEFNGCPDRDGDKIIDPNDECPDKAGLAEFNGCPDSDGDGIPDPKDSCVFEVGPISNKGCPIRVQKAEVKAPEPVKVELTKEEEEVINTVFKNLQFETGKAVIKPVSFPSLNQLADLMKRKEDFKLLIEGHTDNVGGAKMNLTLSQKRAKSAKDYLVKQGVSATRITSKGYGLTKPVAPNTTAEGRQQNRRVEFTIVR